MELRTTFWWEMFLTRWLKRIPLLLERFAKGSRDVIEEAEGWERCDVLARFLSSWNNCIGGDEGLME